MPSTPVEDAQARLRSRRSVAWSIAFRAGYRLLRLLDPLIRSWIANDLPGLGGTVEVHVVGRRTGRPRRTLVTLLPHRGSWYVGHPNGETGWVRNAEAAGWVEIEPPGSLGPRFAVRRLPDGPERDSLIRATARLQPFPANLLYRAARRHIAAVGVYHRLEPVTGAPSTPGTDPADPPTPDLRAPEGAP